MMALFYVRAPAQVVCSAPPQAVDDHVQLLTPRSVVIDVLANDSDPDGDPLLVVAPASSARGGVVTDNGDGTLTYEPPASFDPTVGDSFLYTVREDVPVNARQATAMVVVDAVDTVPSPGDPQPAVPIGVAGSITLRQTATIDFATTFGVASFAQPIVIAEPATANDTDPLLVRITNVSPGGFSLRLDEPPNRDDVRIADETVRYLVIDAGRWRIADGFELEASRVTTRKAVSPQINAQRIAAGETRDFEVVPFSRAFEPGNPQPDLPVLLTQVQTAHNTLGGSDLAWIKSRHQGSAQDFATALELSADATAPPSAEESIGWIAMTPGGGLWKTSSRADQATSLAAFEAGPMQSALTPACPFSGDLCTQSFASGRFASTPDVVAAIASYQTGDAPVELRSLATDAASFTVRYEDEATDPTAPAPTGHGPELVDYVALAGDGVLWGVPLDAPPTAADLTETLGASAASLDFAASGSDPDLATGSDTLAIARIEPENDGLTFGPAPLELHFTPPAGSDAITEFSFRYKLVDSHGFVSDWAHLTIERESATQPPPDAIDDDCVGVPLDTCRYATDEGQDLLVFDDDVLANDVFVGGKAAVDLFYQPVLPDSAGSYTLFAGGLRFTPAPGFTGTAQIFYTLSYRSDPSLWDRAAITITVRANLPPTTTPDTYVVTRGGALHVAVPGVLANDSDPEGNALTARLAANPDFASVSLRADGSFDYLHSGLGGTSDHFSYIASDGVKDSPATTVTVEINEPPTAREDAYLVTAGGTLTANAATGVLANDGDPEGDPLTVVPLLPPSHGDLQLGADGGFTYVHDGSAGSADSFTYEVRDPFGGTSRSLVAITVDQPPIAHFTWTCDSLSCTFDAATSQDDFGITAYEWDFGDGTTATTTTPAASHDFADEGVWTVRLTAVDARQQPGSVAQPVAALDDDSLLLIVLDD